MAIAAVQARFLAWCALFLSPTIALAEDAPFWKYFAEIPGHCISLEVGGKSLGQCKDVVFNFLYKTKRGSFFFFTEKGNILAFSSGKDEQPSLEEYRSEVDSINLDQRHVAAQGSCDVRGDIRAANTDIVCEAVTSETPAVRYRAVFKTSGKLTVHRTD
jgi:hypothetical protein